MYIIYIVGNDLCVVPEVSKIIGSLSYYKILPEKTKALPIGRAFYIKGYTIGNFEDRKISTADLRDIPNSNPCNILCRRG